MKDIKEKIKALEDRIVSDFTGHESARRDIIYSKALYDIILENQRNKSLKTVFFYIVCGVFVLASLGGCAAIVVVSLKQETNATDIATVIAGLGTALGSIITLPSIIAKHLFPENSEANRLEFLSSSAKRDQEFVYIDEVDNPEDVETEEDIVEMVCSDK